MLHTQHPLRMALKFKVEVSPQPINFYSVVNISLDTDLVRSIGNNVAISVVTKKSNLPGFEWEVSY